MNSIDETYNTKHINLDLSGWMDGWMDGSINRLINRLIDKWMDGRIDQWINGSMDQWISGSIDGLRHFPSQLNWPYWHFWKGVPATFWRRSADVNKI